MDATTRLRADRRNIASRERLLQRVRSEFEELPCLRLTRGQVQRLFDLREDVCRRLLAGLVDEGTLTCGPDGRYQTQNAGMWSASGV
jgi:hypothetical protein